MQPGHPWRLAAEKILLNGLPKGSIAATLRPEQERVLDALYRRRDTLYVDRTGGGKSATYFIAAKLLRESGSRQGPAIVVSPLLSLVNDQVRRPPLSAPDTDTDTDTVIARRSATIRPQGCGRERACEGRDAHAGVSAGRA